MADLPISHGALGVALVRRIDPFDTLEIHRIHRDRWQATPEKAGIYLLYGVTPERKAHRLRRHEYDEHAEAHP